MVLEIHFFFQMASWDDHVKTMKADGADEAVICGLDGNIWARSDGFNPTPQEIAILIKVARQQALDDCEKLECDGKQFMNLGELEGEHTGRKVITKNVGDKEFGCVALSNKSVVVVLKKGPQQRDAVQVCEKHVKYLKESGL